MTTRKSGTKTFEYLEIWKITIQFLSIASSRAASRWSTSSAVTESAPSSTVTESASASTIAEATASSAEAASASSATGLRAQNGGFAASGAAAARLRLEHRRVFQHVRKDKESGQGGGNDKEIIAWSCDHCSDR